MPDRGRGLARPSCGVGVVRSFFQRKSHSAPAARLPGLCPGPPLLICGKKNISFHIPAHCGPSAATEILSGTAGNRSRFNRQGRAALTARPHPVVRLSLSPSRSVRASFLSPPRRNSCPPRTRRRCAPARRRRVMWCRSRPPGRSPRRRGL